MDAATFDPIFWAHWPPETQELQQLDIGSREARAADLASKGFSIDVPIMVWGWGAYETMLLRITYGYTYTPAMLSPAVQTAPGLSVQGVPAYDPAAVQAAGGIKVSIDPSDWPPFVKPAPPAATPLVATIILFRQTTTIATVNPAAVPYLLDGQQVTWDGASWTIHKDLSGFMGIRCWAELATARVPSGPWSSGALVKAAPAPVAVPPVMT